MSDLVSDADEAVLQRRRFLRGSALMAAAAGGAVVATAGSALPASATPVVQWTATVGIPPTRVFDTRSEYGQIIDSSPKALTGKGRLRKGSWIDVAIAESDSLPVLAVFVTLTSYSSLKAGSLVATPPVAMPSGTTLAHGKGQRVSTGTIVGVSDAFFGGARKGEAPPAVVRIYATATTHVSLDISGASIYYFEVPPETTPDAQAEQLLKAVRAIHR